ncbi:MAG: Crp/Fnr family transcriptional regulator [Eubacteriales bacterium]|nr:Crp/Fnr family transcriptional regulator [Eubacteriales bacterium]
MNTESLAVSYSFLRKTSLFRGTTEEELPDLLECLAPVYRDYTKNEWILRQGEDVSSVGMVLSGRVQIVEEDFWGNRHILADAWPGDLFAESYAFLPGELLRVSVIAAEPTRVMLLESRRMVQVCSNACRFHSRLVQNVLAEAARKNLALTRKLSHMSKRTTREKLFSYLSSQSLAAGTDVFEIPFNRQQLADFLCVDRSAMSNELCKMRDEGLLSFERNNFHLKSKMEL